MLIWLKNQGKVRYRTCQLRLHRCWLVGFNGQAWDGGLGRWAAFPEANFAGLGVGEVVTVLVHRHHGSLEVLRNGVRVAILPGVLTDMPVFPVVDLLGAAQAVRVVPTPPLFHENLDSGTACFFPEVRTIRTDPEFPIATGELAWVAELSALLSSTMEPLFGDPTLKSKYDLKVA